MSAIYVNSIKDKTNTRELASDSGSAWSWGSGLPSGSIVQVQSTQLTTGASTTLTSTSTDYVVMSGTATASGSGLLDVNITPKITGSKIWLQCNWMGEFSNSSSVYNHMFFFWRNTTKLANTTSGSGTANVGISPATLSYHNADDVSTCEHLFMQYFDTHGISAGTQITYKLGVIVGILSTNLVTNRGIGDGTNTDYERGVSSLVAIELAP